MFLKGDTKKGVPADIQDFDGIEVEWIRGRRAVLTIYDDNGQKLEDVPLYSLKTREEMSALISGKGFMKKTRAQKAAELEQARVKNQLRAIDQEQTNKEHAVTGIYAFAFVVIGVGTIALCGRQGKKAVRRKVGVQRV
mmetsp:Transcript_17283/g.35511  ORF Transcript_17283/g.35511 Transcript_17283/m.35511 type:complete len:138 (+) Transcript_17283:328-741(+)